MTYSKETTPPSTPSSKMSSTNVKQTPLELGSTQYIRIEFHDAIDILNNQILNHGRESFRGMGDERTLDVQGPLNTTKDKVIDINKILEPKEGDRF